jgi:hypothetical protein
MLVFFSKLNRITKSLDGNEQTRASASESTNSAYNFPTTLLPWYTKKRTLLPTSMVHFQCLISVTTQSHEKCLFYFLQTTFNRSSYLKKYINSKINIL